MKLSSLLLLSVIISSSFSGYAQTKLQKPVNCYKALVIITDLQIKYKEQPIFIGNNNQSGTQTILFVNEKAESWTLIEVKEDMACILGIGEKFMQVIPESGTIKL